MIQRPRSRSVADPELSGLSPNGPTSQKIEVQENKKKNAKGKKMTERPEPTKRGPQNNAGRGSKRSDSANTENQQWRRGASQRLSPSSPHPQPQRRRQRPGPSLSPPPPRPAAPQHAFLFPRVGSSSSSPRRIRRTVSRYCFWLSPAAKKSRLFLCMNG